MDLKRLTTSRKIWGATLASIFIIVGAKIITPENVPTVIMTLGGLWSLAIGGQAAKDYMETRNKINKDKL